MPPAAVATTILLTAAAAAQQPAPIHRAEQPLDRMAGVLLDHPHVPGQLVITMNPEPGEAARLGRAAAARQAAERTVQRFNVAFGTQIAVREHDAHGANALLAVPAGEEIAYASHLLDDAEVAAVERNYLGSGGLVQGAPLTPSDPRFGLQWHHRNLNQNGGLFDSDIDSDLAWQITTGSENTVIAVLDTGIDFTHPEFAGRLLADGFDFVNEDADPTADHPHGVWVTGAAAATGDNAFATAGVDWHARILPVKVLDSFNSGTTFDLMQGLNFCASRQDIDIVNMSLINYPLTGGLSTALSNARNAGHILVSCGSNDLTADDSAPGNSPLTIAIGWTNNRDLRAQDSGVGSTIDLVAPGESVVVTSTGQGSGDNAVVSGCSFATPITAGVVGLLLARAEPLGLDLPHNQVRQLLIQGAEDQVGGAEDLPGRDNAFGWGRVNAHLTLTNFIEAFDCNENDIRDIDEINADSSLDINNDSILDTCPRGGCVGDLTGDGGISFGDVSAFIDAFNTGSGLADITSDGLVNFADVSGFITVFNLGCP